MFSDLTDCMILTENINVFISVVKSCQINDRFVILYFSVSCEDFMTS